MALLFSWRKSYLPGDIQLLAANSRQEKVAGPCSDYFVGRPRGSQARSQKPDLFVPFVQSLGLADQCVELDEFLVGEELEGKNKDVRTLRNSRNDIVSATEYPDPTTGAASSSQEETITVDARGKVLTRERTATATFINMATTRSAARSRTRSPRWAAVC